jgi:hypothetical protein
MTRLNFPEAVKLAALRRDSFTCRAPDCGCTAAWAAFFDACAQLGIRLPRLKGAATLGWLAAVGALMRIEEKRQPRLYGEHGLKMTRYRFHEGPDALLQVDHVRESADGGQPVLENAQTLCIVCHPDKTSARGNTRRKGPKLAQKYETRRAG